MNNFISWQHEISGVLNIFGHRGLPVLINSSKILHICCLKTRTNSVTSFLIKIFDAVTKDFLYELLYNFKSFRVISY